MPRCRGSRPLHAARQRPLHAAQSVLLQRRGNYPSVPGQPAAAPFRAVFWRGDRKSHPASLGTSGGKLRAFTVIAIEELGQSLGHDKLANALAPAIHLSLVFGHKSAALEKRPCRQADFRENARRAVLPDRFFSRCA